MTVWHLPGLSAVRVHMNADGDMDWRFGLN